MCYESRRKFVMKLFVTMVDSIVLLSWLKDTSHCSLRSLAQCDVNCPFAAIFVDFVMCVCVCVLDRFLECPTGLPNKFFQNLDDTLCFSAPIFFAAFRAVLNWLQVDIKGVWEPNCVILLLEILKEKLECVYVPERSYRKYFLDWSEFLGPRGERLQVIIVQYCTEFRNVCSSAWKRRIYVPTMSVRETCVEGMGGLWGICAAWMLLLLTSATRSPMHCLPLSHIASW